MYILYAFQCEILHKAISLKVVRGPNKTMKMKNFKFCFYFYFQYAFSATIPLYVFELSFPKIILEVLFMGFHSGSIPVVSYNFKIK